MAIEDLVSAAASGCLAARARRAARVVTAHYDAHLRPSRLKVGQFTMLVAIRLTRDPTIGDLAQAVGMDRTTVSRNLKPLERDGLVTLAPGRNDARQVTIKLTALGGRRLDRALPLWAAAQAELQDRLAGHDQTVLKSLEALAGGWQT